MSSEIEPVAGEIVSEEKDYSQLVEAIEGLYEDAQRQVVTAANGRRLLMYWQIGAELSRRAALIEQWGGKGKMLEQLSSDLQKKIPDLKGLSVRNLQFMRQFYEAWPDWVRVDAQGHIQLTKSPISQIPWTHHIHLLQKLDAPKDRLWYIERTVREGWSARALSAQIQTGAHKGLSEEMSARLEQHLEGERAQLAAEVFRDEYNLSFLAQLPQVSERQLEGAMMDRLTDVLRELGGLDWSFVGRQVKLVADEKEFFVDLLFYHRRLRRLIVVELKVEPFRPEFTSKLAFYQNLVDRDLRAEGEEESIGLLLCPPGGEEIAKLTPQSSKPGVYATYNIGDLTEEEQQALPSEAELSREIQRVIGE